MTVQQMAAFKLIARWRECAAGKRAIAERYRYIDEMTFSGQWRMADVYESCATELEAALLFDALEVQAIAARPLDDYDRLAHTPTELTEEGV